MKRNHKLLIAAAAALAAAGGGVAIAASGSSPSEENQAIINDAAQQLGVSPSKLSDALEKALGDRIDAAVAAGRLTKAQETDMLGGLRDRITNMVNSRGPDGDHDGPPPGFRHFGRPSA